MTTLYYVKKLDKITKLRNVHSSAAGAMHCLFTHCVCGRRVHLLQWWVAMQSLAKLHFVHLLHSKRQHGYVKRAANNGDVILRKN